MYYKRVSVITDRNTSSIQRFPYSLVDNLDCFRNRIEAKIFAALKCRQNNSDPLLGLRFSYSRQKGGRRSRGAISLPRDEIAFRYLR